MQLTIKSHQNVRSLLATHKHVNKTKTQVKVHSSWATNATTTKNSESHKNVHSSLAQHAI